MEVAGVNYGGYVTPYTGTKRFKQFYDTLDPFKNSVHRAGVIAYSTEAIAFVASVACAALLQQ
jgi:hypothetical protein